jgi:hypothetical protein
MYVKACTGVWNVVQNPHGNKPEYKEIKVCYIAFISDASLTGL